MTGLLSQIGKSASIKARIFTLLQPHTNRTELFPNIVYQNHPHDKDAARHSRDQSRRREQREQHWRRGSRPSQRPWRPASGHSSALRALATWISDPLLLAFPETPTSHVNIFSCHTRLYLMSYSQTSHVRMQFPHAIHATISQTQKSFILYTQIPHDILTNISHCRCKYLMSYTQYLMPKQALHTKTKNKQKLLAIKNTKQINSNSNLL